VIRTFSFVSAYKNDYTFERGMLTKAANDQKAAAVAEKFLSSTGAVLKARTDAAVESEKAVRDAQTEYDQAVAEREVLRARGLDTKEADIKVARAEAKLAAASRGLIGSTFNLPGADPSKINLGEAWGSVLYAIVEDPPVQKRLPDGTVIVVPSAVRLEAVAPQVAFQTLALPGKSGDQSAKPMSVKLTLDKPGPFKAEGGRVVFLINSDKNLVAVDGSKTNLVHTSSGTTLLSDLFTVERADEGRKIRVTLLKTDPGSYTITPAVKLDAAQDFVAAGTVEFAIAP
jgi:hypothetical protein